MGKRGPKPKPTYLRVLEGNPSGRPIPNNEPSVPLMPDLPHPDWFDERRQKIWKEVCAELAAMRGLSFVDRQMLTLYVDTLAETQRLAIKMQFSSDSIMPVSQMSPQFDPETGKFLGMKKEIKSVKSTPYVQQLIQLKNMALRFAAHFGMTPAARSRVVFLGNGGEVLDELDPFEA